MMHKSALTENYIQSDNNKKDDILFFTNRQY